MSATGTSPELIPFADVRLEQADLAAVARALRGGGDEAGAAFEQAFAARLGARHAVALSSCTAALHLAYLAAGVGPGDEVIVPSLTFVATAAAVCHCGARPVFADIRGPADLSIDPDDVAHRITPRTRAVCAVHFGGYAAPVDRLAALCEAHGLALIEDAAHGPGATLGGRALGTVGRAGAFSLFSNKILAVGEGGVLVSDDDALAAAARGRAAAFGYRLDAPRRALALSRLARVDADVATRRELTRRYRALLGALPEIELPYSEQQLATSSAFALAVLADPAIDRDRLRRALRERHGIQTSVLYDPVHRLTAYRRLAGELELPRTEEVSARELTLPLFGHLQPEQLERVVAALAAELPRA
jgi:dTDP-4-amino-4,6-dideoxygalactose transaminase